ncbi:hypothetical protein Mal64_00140 [Pseudobythopirellula maris]|uniref:THUMP-like domain-containing protein n=1 Tax=Pseudobythopirellula maris TaxID=2527991 RepID=A0A5C5ZRU8_9BACT|nr:hypothetical protein [Pseudobythopirellula maris]TWT89637.1 hypothetical protein Mal64_00140 [Pseudobythopirellula maris]
MPTTPPAGNDPIDPADCAWLLGEEANRLLVDNAEAQATPQTVARLRKSLPPQRAALVLLTVELRRRAANKFSRSDHMFFSRVGLEQATDEWTARYKAERFAGRRDARDLCTGVGGDLIALGGVAPASGVDRDGVLARFAERNAAAYGLENVAVQSCEASVAAVADCAAWHIDPDRRPQGRRTTQVAAHSPSLETLEAMHAATPHAAIKLAPAAEAPETWRQERELEWISRGGECRQLVVWSGALATQAGKRRATAIRAGANIPESESRIATFVGPAGAAIEPATSLGRYVLEPDPAVLAADLSGALAAKHGLGGVEPGVAYFTADKAPREPLLAAFEVLDVMPMDRKRLSAWLDERSVGRLEIKVRGLSVDPAALRKQLRPRGDAEATLLIAPRNGKPAVIAARRVASNS